MSKLKNIRLGTTEGEGRLFKDRLLADLDGELWVVADVNIALPDGIKKDIMSKMACAVDMYAMLSVVAGRICNPDHVSDVVLDQLTDEINDVLAKARGES